MTNTIVNGNEEDIDAQVFDVEKCFDALWVQECINDMYETGLDNDNLSILFLENQNAEIAIKTATGITKRINVKNVIMQGTVWGSMLCTATMDKLGKLMYQNEKLLYKYKGKVGIPALGMVDDIISIQKCKSGASQTNGIINGFIESKKLTLSKDKCNKIHISKKPKKNKECADLKVHDEKMSDSQKEKYLGDIVDTSGKIRATIEDRQKRGYGIVAEILSILSEIPLGQHKMEIGLQLRQAMLVNGMLYNSEAWHSISEEEIRKLEAVDEYLLRSLVKGHSKTSFEFLYLEAGALPIRYIISSRRILYLQTILKRPEEELTREVYSAQKSKPLKGDFCKLVEQDLQMIGGDVSEEFIESCSKSVLKATIKNKIQLAALSYLKDKQKQHSKVRDIVYNKLETQPYMQSPIFTNEEVNTLNALRSRLVNLKTNFKNKFRDDLLCPMVLII